MDHKKYLLEIIKNRRNVRQFSNKIPPTSIIKDILENTLLHTPVKNDVYHFAVDVYGPEYEEEKRALLIQTICPGYSLTAKTWNSPEDIQYYEKLFKTSAGLNYISDWDLSDIVDEYNINTQVLAPYLLVYRIYPNKYVPKKRQYKQAANDSSRHFATIQASMHAMVLSLYANIHNIDVGFCACYRSNKLNKKNTIYNKDNNELLFFIGLGYRDENPLERNKIQHRTINKPKPHDIYEWKMK